MKKYTVTNAIIVLISFSYLLQMVIPGYQDALILAKTFVAEGQFYRLITVALLHGSFFHLGFNLFSLHLLGSPIEAFYGKTRYIVILLTSLFLASITSLIFNPPYVYSIGASGAIFGLFGALAVTGRTIGVDLRTIALIVVMNFIFSFLVEGIDWHAHLGGLIGGAAITLLLKRLKTQP